MDKYNERLIAAKAPASAYLLVALPVLLILLGAVGFFLIPAIGFLLVAAGVFIITFTKDGLSNEYEYILTNGDIDIARVLGKKRRKNLVQLEADKIARMAPADDERVANDISIGKYKVKKFVGKNAPNADEGEKRVAVFVGEGDNQVLYLLDFDAKCIEHMNQVLRGKSSVK